MADATELNHPPPGVPPTAGYAFSGSLWLPVAGQDQGDGTVALKVTGAGATPSATSLKIADGGGTGNQAAVDASGRVAVALTGTTPVSESHLPNLDIALSALRDALRGASSKTLSDIVAALAATLNVAGTVAVSNLPATQPVSGTVAVSNLPATQPISGTVTVVDSVPLSVSVSGVVSTADSRGITERMLAKAPASGYHLWLDPSNADGYTYIAEAPDGSTTGSTVWRGIRLSASAAGAVQTATGFDWAVRTSATWSA